MIERKLIGEPFAYRGHTITARFMGPDLLGYLDEEELSGFYLDTAAVHGAGVKHVDAKIKAEKEEAAKKAKAGAA